MKKTIFCLLTILGFVLMENSCKKPPSTVVPPATPGLASNLHIIDTTQWIQNMAHPDRITEGLYDFTFTQATPYINIHVGDIILSPKGEGFLRKVASIVVDNNGMTLHTTQAYLTDVFKGGTFNFNADLSGMNNSPVGFADSFSNVVFYQSAGGTERLVSGSISMDPSWHFNFAFDTNGVTDFELSATNAAFSGNHTLSVNTPVALSFLNKAITIGDFSKTSIQMVTVGTVQVPVVVTMEVNLTATAAGWANGGGINSQETFSSSGTFNMGLQYTGGAWQNTYDLTPVSTIAGTTFPVTGPVWHGNVSIVPKVNMKLYGVSCAYASVGMDGSFVSSYVQGNWSYGANGWFNSASGALAGILAPHVPAYSNYWNADTVSYLTPFTAFKDSGDTQTGAVLSVLPNKLVVKVLDSYGNPQSHVNVSFTPATSCGSLNPAVAITDANGLASTSWTLGTVHGSQSVTANVKNGGGQPLTGSPFGFTATGQ